MYADLDRCEAFGLDPDRVERIARRLATAAAEARAMGLEVFGGSGTGTLRYTAGGETGCKTEVALIGQGFNGGDGADA